MATTAFRQYSNTKLVPIEGRGKPRSMPIKLAASGNYPAGSRLIETATRGTFQLWTTSIYAAVATDNMEVAAGALGAGVDGNTVIGPSPMAGAIVSVTYTPVATITGVTTNTRTIAVSNFKGTGAAVNTVASLAFINGTNATADEAAALTLSGTASNLIVAAGDVLVFQSTHGGTGLADPGGLVEIQIAPVSNWSCLLAYDAQTDSSGNITLSSASGQVLGDDMGQFAQAVDAYFGDAEFLTTDLPSFGTSDLTYAPVGARLLSGSAAAGVLYLP